ncbi:hypothetical protein [Bacillus salipaludis]|uniref:Phosphohexomutase n=1 Tax=Bacillus salipaludis TaxID=2547811 RepID=A0ABW8RLW7_9BACI
MAGISNLRDLHLEKAIDVTTVPHQDAVSSPRVDERDNVTITTFVESDFFSVFKWNLHGKSTFPSHEQYLLFSVIKGDGALIGNGERYELQKGTHFIIPVGFGELELDGHCELIVSHT